MYDKREDSPPGSFLSYFGDELRLYRERAGLKQADVGDACAISGDLVSKIERAERVPQPETCEALDTLFNSDGHFARLGKRVRHNTSPSARFRAYLDREPYARTLRTFESVLVPGLLQTEDYARAVIRAERPTPTPEQLQARLVARLGRQDVLSREQPPTLWAVIWEAVLNCCVGSRSVMAEQLDHLIACADRPHITLQVLPFEGGTVGPVMGQSFLLATFPEGPDAVHVDTLVTSSADGDAIGRYSLQFDHLRALALSESLSQQMIKNRAEEWRR